MKTLLKLVVNKGGDPFALYSLEGGVWVEVITDFSNTSESFIRELVSAGQREVLHDGGQRIFIPITLG